MARAKAKTGIEGRMIVTGVRHFGVEAVEAAARFAGDAAHPLVTGFGMAGDERMRRASEIVRAFEIAREAGLGITVHAGELAGWESVAAALDAHQARRASAMACGRSRTRSSSSGSPTSRWCWKCCPGLEHRAGRLSGFSSHPFPALLTAGCKVTLNSDDPPYFQTELEREYDDRGQIFRHDDGKSRK